MGEAAALLVRALCRRQASSLDTLFVDNKPREAVLGTWATVLRRSDPGFLPHIESCGERRTKEHAGEMNAVLEMGRRVMPSPGKTRCYVYRCSCVGKRAAERQMRT